ncbi:uncharacterized protein LY89DRAFT_488232 [Mollisia scopiformis]|uniref:Uncharacterized protein n=1 Tax=Mollisia scopiformis TaxID=149040 RepID=A0A194XGP1_MOLSC|nr:uncharacterized protein LY89DRAFT_488232 [Mollisia scopiformis]KUJ19306.1 hypothetical protein LY89DRAFT_488232 [Mollisia scopiformis]
MPQVPMLSTGTSSISRRPLQLFPSSPQTSEQESAVSAIICERKNQSTRMPLISPNHQLSPVSSSFPATMQISLPYKGPCGNFSIIPHGVSSCHPRDSATAPNLTLTLTSLAS